MEHKTDAELVLLTREGNREAFGYLVERYLQMVRRIAIRLIAGEEIARELAQEAILQAYLSLDHLRDPVSFKSWLYGITLNVCKGYLREQKVNVLSLESVMGGVRCDTVFDDAIDPQSVVEERKLRHAVFQEVQNLSPGVRAPGRNLPCDPHSAASDPLGRCPLQQSAILADERKTYNTMARSEYGLSRCGDGNQPSHQRLTPPLQNQNGMV